ncbi:MAG: chemotaxis protein CheA [Nitrospirae bacterium]|nr:chemotaxis protein CheA [Nitrospirota bacterium]
MSDEMEEIISEFITEAEESLDKVDPLFVELEIKGFDKDMLNEIFRSMHTIKGAAGFLGLQSIVDVAHGAENILKKVREGEIALTKQMMDATLKGVDMLRLLLKHIKQKDGKEEDISQVLKEFEMVLKQTEGNIVEHIPAQEDNLTAPQNLPEAEVEKHVVDKKETFQTLRVDMNKIDKVLDLTGEVVLVRNRLLNIMSYLEKNAFDDPHIESLFETVSFLDRITSDMHLSVIRMRMQPIQKVFNKFPRLVRDLSSSLGKDITLSISGEDTEVDKSVIEHIGDPLVHIIRNAIDHGIELPEERRKKGKSEKGTISISAFQKGNQIVIEVKDDGRGLDASLIKKKAIEKKLIKEDEAQRMSDDTAINLIFLPGFSTAEVATEISGRGVGMDVVRTNIAKLNGSVEVRTKKDIGTTFVLNIPLTLAIIQALMVRAGECYFAIPLSSVEETFKVLRKDIDSVMEQSVLNIRGRLYPVFELSNVLGNGNGKVSELDYRYAVLISLGEKKFCITVDELLGLEEIFIKAIKGVDTDLPFILGATITGDGKVVLIIDMAGITRNVFSTVGA